MKIVCFSVKNHVFFCSNCSKMSFQKILSDYISDISFKLVDKVYYILRKLSGSQTFKLMHFSCLSLHISLCGSILWGVTDESKTVFHTMFSLIWTRSILTTIYFQHKWNSKTTWTWTQVLDFKNCLYSDHMKCSRCGGSHCFLRFWM